MDPRDAYDDLARRSREWSTLASCSSLLSWDEQTYLPTAGAGFRGDQLGLLAGLVHDRATDPAVGERLAEVEGSDLVADPESPEAADVREWRRDHDRKVKLPKALVEELARVTSTAQHEWVAARKARDYAHFRPWLERVVTLKRREADCLKADGGNPYDALLDDYEPGARSAVLDDLFARLRAELVPLVEAILGSSRQPDTAMMHRGFAVDRQKVLGELVAASIGFDFDRGRLDVSAHPFCSGIAPGDCRITTRYRPDDFEESFFGVLHEVGHGLYEQGLDPDRYGRPTGEAVSLGVHESQSRLWENLIGRGRPFWSHWFPIARRLFHGALGRADFDAFLFAVNRVEPSLIRTQADEVTYNLHILIRYDLERALLSGDLSTEDLPCAWDEAYRRDLGVVAPDPADGCLQDVHWSRRPRRLLPHLHPRQSLRRPALRPRLRRPRRPRRPPRPGRIPPPPRLAPRPHPPPWPPLRPRRPHRPRHRIGPRPPPADPLPPRPLRGLLRPLIPGSPGWLILGWLW